MLKAFSILTLARHEGDRLDVFLTKNCGQSRNFWQKQIKLANVRVDGRQAKVHQIIKDNQTISFRVIKKSSPKPKPMQIPVIYEDKDILAVNKPAGILTHRTKHSSELALNDLFSNKIKGNSGIRSGVVHRLDRDTSGLVLIAKNKASSEYLTNLFKKKLIKKTYIALVWGELNNKKAILKLPIARSESHRHRMTVDASGKPAVSIYRVEKTFDKCSLVKVQLVTGRTHQIRAQFSYLGHPIVGDKIYSNKKTGLERQFLHAYSLNFLLPNGEKLDLRADLPPDLKKYLNKL